MNHPLVVSTECPTCGAPLDFSEGSNAIRCLHCRAHLLATGRKQVLSYAIPPKIDDKGALKRVRLVQRDSHTPPRFVKAQLCFIPYYRLTGHDFLWERADPQPKLESPEGLSLMGQTSSLFDWEAGIPSHRTSFSVFPSVLQVLSNLFRLFLGTGFQIQGGSSPPPSSGPEGRRPATILSPGPIISDKRKEPGRDSEEAVLRDRYVEKNFLACHLDGLSLYSLGVRPAVLHLTLFKREALEMQGKVVGVGLAPDAALTHGMKAADPQKILYRQVIGQILSVVYFPFWVIELEKKGEGRLQIVDAVSERVVQMDAPVSAYKGLDEHAAGTTEVIGFRPLTCPNCGWDLPAKPEDVIFVCVSCEKAWQIRGNDLYEVAYAIADAGALTEPVKYLPFWVLEIQAGTDQLHRYFVPAFGCRRLRMLSDLARKISQKQPEYVLLKAPKPELHGCYYDQEDAAKLAQFIHAGLDKSSLEEADLEKIPFHVKNATLTWFPFSERAGGLVDPFTGFSLPKNLLL